MWGEVLKRGANSIWIVIVIAIAIWQTGCLGGGKGGNASYAVSGRVVDQQGNGIEGVLIIVDKSSDAVVTDSQGRWMKGNVSTPVEITPFMEQHVFEPESIKIASEARDVNFVGYRLPTNTELIAICQVSTDISEMLVSGKTNEEIMEWANNQSIVEQSLVSGGELSIKYKNGGWECWVPATPLPTNQPKVTSLCSLGATDILKGRALVINCCSNEPRMKPHFPYLVEAKRLLESAGLDAELIEVGPGILDTLRSLQDCSVVVVFAHGTSGEPFRMTTGIEWGDAYDAEWCKGIFAKLTILYQEHLLGTFKEYKQVVGITPKFWSAYYSSQPFGGTIFINGACSGSKYDEPYDSLDQLGVRSYFGWTGIQNKGAVTAQYLLSHMANGLSVGQAFDLLPQEDKGYDNGGTWVELVVRGDKEALIKLPVEGRQMTHNVSGVAFVMSLAPEAIFPTGRNDASSASVDNDFWVSTTEVTYELWHVVRSWATNHGYIFENPGREGSHGGVGQEPSSQGQPVTTVNWRDSIVWCNALSEILGYEPLYRYEGIIVKDATSAAVCDSVITVDNGGFRLPTDKEWELAARYRGGDPSYGAIEFPARSGMHWTPGSFASGAIADTNNAQATKDAAWYLANSNGSTQPVGSKPMKGNGLGVFDMSGNVYEWCFEWHPSHIGTRRIARAGSFGSGGSSFMAINNQGSEYPGYVRNYIGVRLVRTAF